MSLSGDADNAIQVFPRPAQLPAPPLWVAAFGPKALTQAGRLGLPYLCSPMESLSRLEANYKQHRQAAAEAGETYPEVVPLMRTVFVSRDRSVLSDVRKQMAARTENTRLDDGEGLDDWTLMGEPEFVADKIAEYTQRLGMTHLIATRLRIGGLEEAVLRDSVSLLADLTGHR